MDINIKNSVGFVFTNYNNTNITIQAIESIINLAGQFCPFIVIVDNNSRIFEQQRLEKFKEKFDNVKIIKNAKNLGYFPGLNIGIEFIRNNHPGIEIIVVGNNDLIFPSNFFMKLKQKQSLCKEYPVISPNIITLAGEHQNPHVIEKITFFREIIYDLFYFNYFFAKVIKYIASNTIFFTDRKDEKFHDVPQTIYQGYGACYILTPLFFRYFEKLWAPTFLMGEEFFLSLQLQQNSLAVFYEPTIVVHHNLHSTMVKVPSRELWEIAKKSHKIYRRYNKLWGKNANL
ncbi:glycosyltransferase family 2 protein [bacterium]|nr:glycosyltransferase family 2 protein [bacterium]